MQFIIIIIIIIIITYVQDIQWALTLDPMSSSSGRSYFYLFDHFLSSAF